jgi:hypothetical protein
VLSAIESGAQLRCCSHAGSRPRIRPSASQRILGRHLETPSRNRSPGGRRVGAGSADRLPAVLRRAQTQPEARPRHPRRQRRIFRRKGPAVSAEARWSRRNVPTFWPEWSVCGRVHVGLAAAAEPAAVEVDDSRVFSSGCQPADIRHSADRARRRAQRPRPARHVRRALRQPPSAGFRGIGGDWVPSSPVSNLRDERMVGFQVAKFPASVTVSKTTLTGALMI